MGRLGLLQRTKLLIERSPGGLYGNGSKYERTFAERLRRGLGKWATNFVGPPSLGGPGCRVASRGLGQNLCRCLCRNAAIPTHLSRSHWVSLGNKCEAASMQQTSMNTGDSCHLRPHGITQTSFGHRFRDQGVGGFKSSLPRPISLVISPVYRRIF